ncbi:hypothetical protein KQI52_05195 [bacterium]|nr:hypothetical protein [bacterium]
MKKLAWLVLALMMVFSVQHAEATVIEFGGGTGFENRGGDVWSGDESQEGFYQYDFRPHFAIFLNHNTTLGAYFNLNVEDYANYSLFEIELGPRIGYYFKQYGPGYPYVQARVSLGGLFYDTASRGSFNETHIATELGGGYMYLLNQNVGVTGGLYYELHFYDKYEDEWVSGNKFGLQLGVRIFVY